MDNVHRVLPAELSERLLQVDVLPGAGGQVDRLRDAPPLLCALPWDEVLDPRRVARLQRLAQPDARLHPDMAEMIERQGNVVPDLFTDRSHISDQYLDAF